MWSHLKCKWMYFTEVRRSHSLDSLFVREGAKHKYILMQIIIQSEPMNAGRGTQLIISWFDSFGKFYASPFHSLSSHYWPFFPLAVCRFPYSLALDCVSVIWMYVCWWFTYPCYLPARRFVYISSFQSQLYVMLFDFWGIGSCCAFSSSWANVSDGITASIIWANA